MKSKSDTRSRLSWAAHSKMPRFRSRTAMVGGIGGALVLAVGGSAVALTVYHTSRLPKGAITYVEGAKVLPDGSTQVLAQTEVVPAGTYKMTAIVRSTGGSDVMRCRLAGDPAPVPITADQTPTMGEQLQGDLPPNSGTAVMSLPIEDVMVTTVPTRIQVVCEYEGVPVLVVCSLIVERVKGLATIP